MLKMSNAKVHTKFGTCRLCLEDIGQYLIVPKVRERIKYCFDINVEPIDGLPQLLCKSCEDILKEFFETKKRIVDKQNDLINNIGLKNAETQHTQETNEPPVPNSISEPSKPMVAKSKQIVLSFSCNRLDQPSQYTAVKKQKNQTKKSVSWLSYYKKEFACRLCNYHVKKKQNILKHIRTSHKSLKTKYEHILKNNCKIKLDKLDNVPNITGLNEVVVISTEKIVQDVESSYFIIYTPKDIIRSEEKHDKSGSSSDDDCSVKKKRKISNDTLESRNEEQPDCVNVEDLSKDNVNGICIKNDDSDTSEKKCNNGQAETNVNSCVNLQKPILTNITEDHKCKIQNIISLCHNKYKKNLDLHKMHRPQQNNPALSKSQLKHKVLSIGRKIINKQGFNCTGFLRYMEHRNLEIVWTPNASNFNSDTNYVRIMTKLKGNVVDEDDLGWKMLPANQVLPMQSSESSMPKISQVFYSERNAHWKEDTKNKLLNKNPVPNPKQMPRKTGKLSELVPANLTQTCLNNKEQDISKPDEVSGTGHTMPEINITSLATHKTCKNTKEEHTKNDTMPSQNANDNETELSTGRIKVKPLAELLSKEGLMNTFNVGNSTTSNPVSENTQSNIFACLVQRNDIQTNCIVQPTSYIDPVNQINLTGASHLNLIQPIIQPSQVLQTIDNTQISYPFQTIIQVSQPSVNPTNDINLKVSSNQKKILNQVSQLNQQVKSQTSQKATENLATSISSSTRAEFVIMDTKELPSVETNSPIQYFESLLKLHNICLLDKTNDALSHFFVCLIRFKVLYKQDTMEEPILLSLSLFCYKNLFCIRVKNMNLENIDISKISASWQWEIIKVFKGEVANKMLQNAQNVNQETYEYASTFLTLLKSIKYTKV